MRVILVTIFIAIASLSFADQLAYISKDNAEEAASYISKMKYVYLFCGCCSLVEPKKVKVVGATFRYTGYENYYEVYLQYEDELGKVSETPLDLAYVWKKRFLGYKTIGELMHLDHDPCVRPKDWNRLKHIEQD